MAPPERRRGRDEADDERAQSGDGGDGGAVSAGEQEAEGALARRVGRADRLPPVVCGGAAARPRPAAGWMARAGARRRPRQRRRRYDAAVVAALRQVWVIMDCICGKRLAAVLPEMIAVLERHDELQLAAATRQKLCAISAASIDRLLAPERRRLNVRGRSGTKPGTLLKHQIPIRTFTEWDQTQPGFVEIDLVGHDAWAIQSSALQSGGTKAASNHSRWFVHQTASWLTAFGQAITRNSAAHRRASARATCGSTPARVCAQLP